MGTSPMVPAFGGKVVAVGHPLPFVPDFQERIEDVNRFFDETTSLPERLLITKKHNISFLLIDKHRISIWQEIKKSSFPGSRVVFENNDFILISLNDALQL